MKPLVLKMKAFGSYAKEVTVDFTQFEHGLYLITGDTGAGKTTIFDGIMFALFEQASGIPDSGNKANKQQSGMIRTFEMMHSDYADPYEETLVYLKFKQEGKVHEVRRTCRQVKARKTSADARTAKYNTTAILTEEGKDPIEQSTKVNARIVELLGMNADQFRKIIMLAQGEFSKFLSAGSESRKEILGGLFGDSMYRYYQKLISGARKMLSEERSEYTGKISSALEQMNRDGMSEEERVLYLAEHSELLTNLQTLHEKDQKTADALARKKEEAGKAKSRLDTAKGEAEQKNARLDELERQRTHLADLELKKEQIDAREIQLDAFERVWFYVLPAEKDAYRARKDLRTLLQDKVEQERVVSECGKTCTACEEEVNRTSNLADEVRQLDHQIGMINETEGSYRSLAGARKEKQSADRKAEGASEKLRQIRKQTEDKKLELNDLKEQLENLSGIEAKTVELKHKKETAEEQMLKFTDAGGFRDRIVRSWKKEQALSEKEQTVLAKGKESAELASQYAELYAAFIAGQAGIIAESVEKELVEKETAVCPVCGSVIHRGHHFLAVRTAKTPDEKKVNKARQAMDEADRIYQNMRSDLAAACASLEAEKNQIVAEVDAIRDETVTWELLTSKEYLSGVLKEYRNKAMSAALEWKEASEDQKTFYRFRDLQKKLEEEIEAAGKDAETVREEAESARETAARNEEVIRTLSEKLSFATWEEACREKKSLETDRIQKQTKIDKAEQDRKEADAALNKARGQLDRLISSVPDKEETAEQAEARVREVLAEQHFPDPESAHAAMTVLPPDERDGNRWLTAQRKQIQDYRSDCTNTEKALQDLEKETAGYVRTDMTVLTEQIRSAEETYGQADRAVIDFEKIRANHEDTAKRVKSAKDMLHDTEAAWNLLNPLAEVADGVASADGKWDFDSYVMGAMFREVLGMANQRLNIMSGGQYELEHGAVGKIRSNSDASMEISVLDMTTGKARKAASLSGGEKFLASLSLALGLSDVMQAHAGGVQLDSLFIDEGFGSLDSNVLDQAVNVLNQLTEGSRQVGIISHVARLEESIPQQICVKRGENGSTLSFRR